jgi:hypothetical protein
MPFAEDFSVFTNPQDFGVVGLWTPTGGVAVAVNGIFDTDRASALIHQHDFDVELGMEGSGPCFRCAGAEVPGIKHDDSLTLTAADAALLGVATDYVVKGVRPDGTGLTLLILELAP